MEFLRPSRHRTLLSEAVYVALNLGVVLLIFSLVYFVGSPLAAFGVVLLSKWRVLAVRPQYWYTHVVANSIDVIVGLSFVVLLTAFISNILTSLILTAFYIAWLLLLKPQSKRKYVVAQAAVGLLLGSTALAHLSHDWYASATVVIMGIIGYSAARHTLQAYSEPHTQLLSLVFALIMAEIGWMSYYWTLSYTIPFPAIEIPQVTILVGFLGFLVERAYASYHKHRVIRIPDMTLPLLLSLSSLILLLTLFNGIQGL